MRARISRVDAPQTAKINAKHSVQLLVRHPEIPPVAIDFMATSQYIRNTKAAMKIAYRIETGITVKDTVRMPVSMDMIQGHHAATQRGDHTAIDLAVYTAQVLAFTTLSKVSEYTQANRAPTH